MSTKRSAEEKPLSSSDNKKKEKETRYVLYKEKNGWEQETWYTFIPIEKDNKEQIKKLLKVLIASNKAAKESDKRRDAGPIGEIQRQSRKMEVSIYSKYGIPVPPPVNPGATFFELDTKRTYTKEEAEHLCLDNETSYRDHSIMFSGDFAEDELDNLVKWVKEGKGDDIYHFLYKGGIDKLV